MVIIALKGQLHLAQGNTLGNDDAHTPGALKGQLNPAQGNTLGSKGNTLGSKGNTLGSKGNTLGNDDTPSPWRPVRAATQTSSERL